MTQSQLAEAAGVSVATVSNYESGKRQRIDVLRKFAKALRVDIYDLITGGDELSPDELLAILRDRITSLVVDEEEKADWQHSFNALIARYNRTIRPRYPDARDADEESPR